ncbi:MAG: metallophosphoesterase [Ardenticatenaceae bacterium]|nr:metallophosphoesterase [Ardenticatenaceae bacterium]
MAQQFNFLFVSDFHLSEGRNPANGLIHRNEDFFQDIPFAQMIAHHVKLSRRETAVEYHRIPWKLVINGDIFDFLQVVSLPREGAELFGVKGVRSQKELSKNEQDFGLGTSSPEIVWKVSRIAQGHPTFFQALAWFVAQPGNELILMKGNHDIELYWPDVQLRLRQLLQKAYEDWRKTAVPGDDHALLPYFDDLPEALSLDMLQKQVRFPTAFLYEPGLFYAEHGCQFEPANAFRNFEDPRLVPSESFQEAANFIELPSGSLFVRYFFNDVEHIHPFADNMKPISRYVFWLLRHAPGELTTFAWKLLPQYLRARREVNKKMARQEHEPPQEETADPFLRAIHDIQIHSRESISTSTWQTLGRLGGSVLLVLVAVALLFLAVRVIALGTYWPAIIAVLLALIFGYTASGMMQSLDHLLEGEYLFQGAGSIARLLNGNTHPGYGSVRYFIFGHDHAANVQLLPPTDKDRPNYRQWYVNTGAWVPVFSESERLLRQDEQLTFLRLVPGRVQSSDEAQNRDMPELLQWSAQANAPLDVRLFAV